MKVITQAVDADYSLDDLSRFLRSLRVGKTGVAILATLDGRLLAGSNDMRVVTSEGERLAARDSSDPLVAFAADYFGDVESTRKSDADRG